VTSTTSSGVVVPEQVRLAVDGGEIQLQRGGAGAPLLLLHGGGSGTWGRFHDLLAQRFEVIAPVHPSFGLSDEIDRIEGVDDLVYHYLDLLDRLQLPAVDLLGLSFGGWLAAELAVHSPSRFAHLVLVAPAGLRIPEHPIRDIFLMSPPERLAALFHDPSRLPRPDPSDSEAAFLNYKNMTGLARFGWNPFMNDPKLERRLYRVAARTCVIVPEEDGILPRAHGERYASKIAGAQLTVLPGAAHAVDSEDPDALAGAVLEFLGR
jgi:pimeloyl-ACP methyl ester carboxylesterase